MHPYLIISRVIARELKESRLIVWIFLIASFISKIGFCWILCLHASRLTEGLGYPEIRVVGLGYLTIGVAQIIWFAVKKKNKVVNV